ncbi:MAG TPA: gluconate 2-dehydrogenase subunit 3 family protein [Vicinamibacterales bacterium]|nr:gluconate 2-dehydrogenase subunit 3 family protein [Vicinamibacterales bacterium]
MTFFISRRELLKRAGVVGAAAAARPVVSAVPFGSAATRGETETSSDLLASAQTTAGTAREPLESLTAGEADILEAVVARLIPTDANGPGAVEARAVRYIDRALAGALSTSRSIYTAGLEALDRFARSSRGVGFKELSTTDQDAVLTEVEKGSATGFTGSSATFFNVMLAHTHQGMFGDPYYGGNADFVGWDLIGYPGVRTMVTAEEQRMGVQVKPNHKSAYDYDLFTKAAVRVPEDGRERTARGQGRQGGQGGQGENEERHHGD